MTEMTEARALHRSDGAHGLCCAIKYDGHIYMIGHEMASRENGNRDKQETVCQHLAEQSATSR